MNVRGGSTGQGTIIEVADCNSASESQKFMFAGLTDTATGGGSTPSGGTNPCAAFCSYPTVFNGANYTGANLGTGAICRETATNISGGGRYNLGGRSFSINGVAQSSSDGPFTLPAKVNGGYCFQFGSGGYSYASFNTY